MKHCLPFLFGTGLLLGQTPTSTPSLAAAEPPRLVVLCSIDQLASWVLDAALPHFAPDGGFRRLLTQGARFPNCAYQHACSETGPGHATIGTGAPAVVHGIVRNSWWNPKEDKLGYCVSEPMPALPGLPEGKDRGPGKLLVPTLGDQVRSKLPGAKVASVAWKDRSAILMAGRGADCVAWFEYSTGNLVTNTAWGPQAPAWLTAFNERKQIDAFHGWNWERFAKDEAYADVVDDRPYEVPHLNGSNARTLPQPLTGGKPEPGVGFYTQVYASPVGNEMVRLAAEACVVGMALGQDAVPDLLCVGFSSTDVVGHQFGPDSVEARDTLLRLDRQLGQLLAFFDSKVGTGKYAIFVTADHGIGPTPEWAKAQGLPAGRGLLQTQARAAAEKALATKFGPPPDGKRYVAHVGEFSLYLDPLALAAIADPRGGPAIHREACEVAAAAAAKAPGMLAAFPTADVTDKNAVDPIRRALAFALCPGRAGDVQVVVKPYWLDGVTPASHGTPHPYDREVVGFAMGPGIAVGARFDAPVTPGLGTVLLARLLGIDAPPGAVDTLPDGLVVGR
jgi:hypothetical protein